MLKVYDLLPKLFSIYLFAVLFYTKLPFKLTVITGIVIILDLMYIYVKRLCRKRLYLLIWLAFVLLFTSIVTNNVLINFSDYTRIVTYFLFIGLISDRYDLKKLSDAFNRNRKLLLICSVISSFVILVCLLLPECYAIENSWGEHNRYFLGFSETFHVNASCMCLCLAMYLYSISEKKYKITEMIFLLPPLLAIIQSGARVYLACVFSILIIYYVERIGTLKIKYMFVPIAIIGGGYYLLNSNMMKKFLFVQENYVVSNTTQINSLTSGRLGFWQIGIEGFLNSNILHKLFGHGFNYIRDITGHSGHNDLVHMLLGMGIIGLVIYLYYMKNAIKMMHTNINYLNRSKFIKLLYTCSIVIYIFTPMIMNGLFGYQHLLYSFIIISIILADKAKVGEV